MCKRVNLERADKQGKMRPNGLKREALSEEMRKETRNIKKLAERERKTRCEKRERGKRINGEREREKERESNIGLSIEARLLDGIIAWG